MNDEKYTRVNVVTISTSEYRRMIEDTVSAQKDLELISKENARLSREKSQLESDNRNLLEQLSDYDVFFAHDSFAEELYKKWRDENACADYRF